MLLWLPSRGSEKLHDPSEDCKHDFLSVGTRLQVWLDVSTIPKKADCFLFNERVEGFIKQLHVFLVHCTLRLTVAVLSAMFGSGVCAMVAAFAVIVEPGDPVTFTVSRTVHVVFGAMLLFSWQTICPVPW